MRRPLLLALTLGLAACSVCAAGIQAPTEFFKITAWVDGNQTRKEVHVRVQDGQLAFAEGRPTSDWEDRKESRPDRWYVLGTKIKSSMGPGYLAYDPSGKDPRVYLSGTAGDGTDWKISDRQEGKGDFNDPAYGVTQAAVGAVKGWYLDIEESEEKGKDGKMATVYRLVLRKEVAKTKVHTNRLTTYRATAP
jgi:ABC-type glycerol-3-phosphate transport system substrate-binding protein